MKQLPPRSLVFSLIFIFPSAAHHTAGDSVKVNEAAPGPVNTHTQSDQLRPAHRYRRHGNAPARAPASNR